VHGKILEPRATASRAARVILALLLLVAVGVATWNHPFGLLLALGLGLYALVLWRYPRIGLPALLALLPLLNFAPSTGWLLLNEFDQVVVVTLAVRLLQPRVGTASAALSRGAKWIIALVAASFFASALVGLLPLSAFDANAFYTYYSSFNSLRVLKGIAWALALLPLVMEEMRQPQRLEQRWVAGMLLGLCGVVAVIIWQRAVFSGLLDFAGDYRVEGSFPELHVGGGDVHAYLVMAIAFVLAWVVQRQTSDRIALGAALFILASYSLGVTFTRGAYVGYFAVLILLGIGLACHWSRHQTRHVGSFTTVAAIVAIGVAVLIPILSGSFMETRFARTQAEATTRTQHWARAIEMMDWAPSTTLFGMGLGSFPRTLLFKHPDAASATFSYAREDGGGFLRLGSGRPLYLDQRVSVAPGASYTLALDIRSSSPRAKVDVTLCEKSVQHSFRCKAASVHRGAIATGWVHHEVTISSEQVGSGLWPLRRPVALSLANSQPGSVVDVDNVRLLDESGRDLVANGDFSEGGARWYFSADDHLPWHIFNLWVEVLFEQGIAGVLLLALAVLIAVKRLALGMWKGDLFAATLLAALGGFLVIGLTESLFDGARVTTLFFLLLFLGLLRQPAARQSD
jgi:hypothetical protein